MLEALPPETREEVRRSLWARRRYLVITGGRELVREALRGFPDQVRELCGGALVRRFDDRGGGGFWPESNDIWLAAGVETYESRRQVFSSARHELFHYVCWNHPVYRLDEERGFATMLGAIADSRPEVARFPRYRAWTLSFLRQGDHANPVEYFADIPTNFPSTADLPPAIARYFGALIDGSAAPVLLTETAEVPLEEFHRLIAGEG